MARIRSAREVFKDHLRRRLKGLEEEDTRENYAEDVVLLTCIGTNRGYEGLCE